MAKYNRYDLKKVTKTLYDVQDMRKRMEGRLGLKSNGTEKERKIGDGSNLRADINPEVFVSLSILLEQLKEEEKVLVKQQKAMIDDSFPFGEILRSYPGIDYKLAGVLLSEIDIVEGKNVSKLWRFCGLDPTAKSKKGEKNKYNKFLKTKLVGTFGHMQVTHFDHPLRPFYDARKMRREAQGWGNDGSSPKGHRNNDAIRYAVKMWIAKWLYPKWRAFEGLYVRPPYQEEYLGHKHGEVISFPVQKKGKEKKERKVLDLDGKKKDKVGEVC